MAIKSTAALGGCGSFSQVTSPLRNAFSALAASVQISKGLTLEIRKRFSLPRREVAFDLIDYPHPSVILLEGEIHI